LLPPTADLVTLHFSPNASKDSFKTKSVLFWNLTNAGRKSMQRPYNEMINLAGF
jgi:hypothetical protein